VEKVVCLSIYGKMLRMEGEFSGTSVCASESSSMFFMDTDTSIARIAFDTAITESAQLLLARWRFVYVISIGLTPSTSNDRSYISVSQQ